MALSRRKVYEAIDGERSYQQLRWGVQDKDELYGDIEKPVESYMLYMRHYLNKAEEAISTKLGTQEALNELRKVVGLGVACFEQHGVPERDFNNITHARTGKAP